MPTFPKISENTINQSTLRTLEKQLLSQLGSCLFRVFKAAKMVMRYIRPFVLNLRYSTLQKKSYF